MGPREIQEDPNTNNFDASRGTSPSRFSDRKSMLPTRDENTTKQVGFVYDQRMELHQGPAKHPEAPERLASVYKHLLDADVWNYLHQVEPREATREELMRVHPESHLDKIFYFEEPEMQAAIEKKGGRMFPFGSDTFVSKDTPLAARLSSGCLLSLCDAVMDPEDDVTTGFALIRPPGHHAGVQTAMGFCFFNNIAVAARHLQEKYGMKKIAIVDWDVHHGNGTNDIFLSDPDILFMSFHRSDADRAFFPGTGDIASFGKDGAKGYTINVPLGKGFGDADVMYVYDHVFSPAIAAFEPDFVLVSAGFDAANGDSVGGCSVSARGFAYMTSQIHAASHGKCIFALEGGYNTTVLPRVISSLLEELVVSTLGNDTRLTLCALEKLSLIEYPSEACTRSSSGGGHEIRDHDGACPKSKENNNEMARRSTTAKSREFECCASSAASPSRISSNDGVFRKNGSSMSFSSDGASMTKKNNIQIKTVDMCHQSTEIHNSLGLGLPVAPKLKKKHSKTSKKSIVSRSSYSRYPMKDIESIK